MTDTLELVRSLTDEEWAYLASRLLTGPFPTARTDQLRPDGDWSIWLIMSGRGWGKTRTGAEDLVEQVRHGGDWFVAAPTYGDVRDVCVEGPSGLLRVLQRRCIDHTWNRSLGEITLPHGRIKAGSADEPERWRGWNFRGGWCDELGAWRRPDAFTQLRLATRIGDHPRIVVTTTPRPTQLLRSLVDQPTVTVTRGRTWDNADNLSAAALDELRRSYEGTRLGRQELEGELLTDTPGALWTLETIRHTDEYPDLDRVVVAIDPAVTSGEDSDETGIVVAGKRGDEFYVLADSSGRYSPDGWAQTAVRLADEWQADRVVGEVNNGGDMVERTLRSVDRHLPYRAVRASRGKAVRAEPVAALYEQGRVSHVGCFDELERQLCEWTPDAGWSPDRLDALVWAVTELMEPSKSRRVARTWAA